MILSYTYNFTTPNFFIVQAHTQYHNLSLSTLKDTESNTNSDTAILTLGDINNPSEGFNRLDYVLRPPSRTTVQALVTVILSNEKGERENLCQLYIKLFRFTNGFLSVVISKLCRYWNNSPRQKPCVWLKARCQPNWASTLACQMLGCQLATIPVPASA